MCAKKLDFSLYLVTNYELNNSSRSFLQTIEEAILGGVTMVQLREKHLNTRDFIERAKMVQDITKRYRIPLIINDNIDVAKAIDAEGVHVGQEDTPCCIVRKQIGADKIIGVSVETVEQAQKAISDGADYIGIQICYPTSTKTYKRPFAGHIGVREILESIEITSKVKTVAIGGISTDNAKRIISQSKGSNGRSLDGVAVVSQIMSTDHAILAASVLKQEVEQGKYIPEISNSPSLIEVLDSVTALLDSVKRKCPLVLHLTNHVVMNDTANVTLALGGSPIMSYDVREAQELTNMASSVVINIGTLNGPLIDCMITSGKYANASKTPVILDPVGVGATNLRRSTTRDILNLINVDIIKGNVGEISAIANIVGCNLETEIGMRGVDTGEILSSSFNPVELVEAVARRERCIVAMTGKVDYISNGILTVSIENGHPYLSKITGSGCMVTAAIGCFAGVTDDYFSAAIAGILCINIAAEHAAGREEVKGPGTFRQAFMDEVEHLDSNCRIEFKFKDITTSTTE